MRYNERLSISLFSKFILFLVSLATFLLYVFIVLLVYRFLPTSIFTYYAEILYAVLKFISFIVVLFVIRKPINANYKITWSILLLLFPFPFIFLLLINNNGSHKAKKRRLLIQKSVNQEECIDDSLELKNVDLLAYNLTEVVKKSTYAPVYKNTKYTFFNDISDKFNDLLEETKKASKFIYIEYFTISKGKLWERLYPILLDRGTSGVVIRILYDDIGSKLGMRKNLIKSLKNIPNCCVSSYEKVGETPSVLLNYRDHRKIYIIDGKIAYCGGDNLADEYIHEKIRFGYWRDNCGKYEGKTVEVFVRMFREMWYISTNEFLVPSEYNNDLALASSGYYMAFSDGPLYLGNPGYDLFFLMISISTSSIFISTPYFIIDDALIHLLCTKAKSGVDVKILMPGIPDKRAPYYMGQGLYGELLLSGVKIYEYTPGFNHAKNLIVDGKYAYIGTINFDYRSLFLHYECGALIMYDKEIKKMEDDYNNAILKSEPVVYEKWKKRPLYQRFWAFIISVFNPLF